MNTTSLPAISFLAVLAASIFLPISAAASCIALTVTGVLAMLVSDYGRNSTPLQLRAEVISGDFSGRNATELNRAA
jgi:hypothetical protein